MQTDELLDERQAATRLHVTPNCLQAWRHRGGGPRFLKMGRVVRYRNSDLDGFLDASVRSSTSDPGRSAR